jgi:hypothetical protein
MTRFGLSAYVLAPLLALAASARAQEEVADPLALQVHAFVSQGFLLSTGNNYLARTKRGTFEFTEVGINFTKPLTNELRVGLQLFARDLGEIGDYSPKVDWFYLDYRFQDWLGLRAGRVKLPFGLYNEVNDIDSAHGVVLLPQSLYSVTNRDFLLAQTGAELYGYVRLGYAGALDYRVYGGTIFLEVETQPGTAYEIQELNIPYVVGGRLLYETPLEGLRAGGSVQALHLDSNLLLDPMVWIPMQMMGDLPASFMGLVELDITAVLWVASIEYWVDDLQLVAEYGRQEVETENSHPMLLPIPSRKTTSERGYVMVGYRIAPWLRPNLYYALIYPNIDDRKGRDAQRHDVALTLRFDINDHWLVKLEGHFLHGTAELRPALNDGTPDDEMKRNWALFAVKTTAYF